MLRYFLKRRTRCHIEYGRGVRLTICMAKQKTIYSCNECGGQTLKWQGQCPHCQAWNTLVEAVAEKSVSRFSPQSATSQVQNLSTIDAHEEPRFSTGIDELDRVLGTLVAAKHSASFRHQRA